MTQQKQPYNRFAFYHQNEALLFQFFLQECLVTYSLLNQSSSALLLKQVMGDSVNKWQTPQGHIHKLLHYYELQKSHFDDTPSMKMVGQTLEQAYQAGQICVQLMAEDSKEHKKPFQQLKREIKKMGKLLLDQLPHYHDNPHVLYFVLCHHNQLGHLYGKSALIDNLTAYFPGGLPEIEGFLSEKFTQKGFHHLLPTIQKQMETLTHE